jgi:hypothetical protein
MKRMPWRKTDRREARFLFLDEFEYDAIPGRKALQLFDIDNATLYIFVYRGNCRKEELLDGRLLIRSQEPEFLKTCQLIAGRMGEAAPDFIRSECIGCFPLPSPPLDRGI